MRSGLLLFTLAVFLRFGSGADGGVSGGSDLEFEPGAGISDTVMFGSFSGDEPSQVNKPIKSATVIPVTRTFCFIDPQPSVSINVSSIKAQVGGKQVEI